MPEPGEPPVDRYHLGLLLVHGIGEQPEGDTLLAFGEPIVRWLRRWFASSPASALDRPTIEEVSASLHPSRELRAEPAHAELRVRACNHRGHPVEQRWLIAESWWGGDIQRPLFGKLAFWMLTVGAWVVFSHFGKHRRFGTGIAAEAKATLVSLGVSLPIVLAFQVGVLALSILAVLPVPQIRRSLSTLLLAMTGVLGDAFVLIENPLQRAAIVERARRSLHWLAERSQGIIVLAHSQGAAIAHQALRRAAPRNVEGLLTFGSGLQKLAQIEFAQRHGYAMTTAVGTPLTAGLLALLIPAFLGPRVDALAQLGLWMLATLALVAFLLLHLTMRTYWIHYGTEQADELARPLLLLTKNARWVDVFATDDPVPNGPLYREASPFAPVSKEIVNRRDPFTDHTTYLDNDAEFLPLVTDSIERVAGLRVIEPADCSAVQAATARHRWCVRWLAVNRWAAGAGLVAAAVLFAGELAAWGTATLGVLGSIPLGVKGLAEGFVKLVDGLAGWAGARLGFAPRDAGLAALGFLLPLAVIELLKMAFAPVWRLWSRETVWRALAAQRVASAQVSTTSPAADGDVRAAEDPGRAGASPVGRKLHALFLVDAAVIGLGVAPLVLILAWRFGDPRQALQALLWVGGGLVLLGMVGNMIAAVALLKERAGALRASRGWGFQVWIEILSGMMMLAVFLSLTLSFIPGVPTWLGPALIYGFGELTLLILALAGWANLLGRFAGSAWKVLAVGVPLLISAGLSTGALLWSDASAAALATVPLFGVLLGLGLIWLIATIAERRVRGAHGSPRTSR